MRVRPHRLRHTYGTQLAAAGIDLLALRELMGHASPETTSLYVHLSTEHLAAGVRRRPGDPGRCPMSAAMARAGAADDHGLLPAYVEHCQGLGLSDRAYRDRLRTAQAFLAAHPDLHAWMQRPTGHRVLELRRTGAWPLLVFAIGTGRLRLDVGLATGKHLQGLGAILEDQHRTDFAIARDAGLAWAGPRGGSRPCCTSAWPSCWLGTVGR